MEVEQVAAALLLLCAAKALLQNGATVEPRPRPRTRRCWVKDFRKNRDSIGETQKLLKELTPSSSEYKNFLRMDEGMFSTILSSIRTDIEKNSTMMRNSISPEEKLSIALRFLATGESFQELDFSTKLSKAFLSTAIMEVCEAIYRNLKGVYLKVK